VPNNSVIHDLLIYPVKALRGYSQLTAEVEIWGLQGDRRWMVVRPDGSFLTQRELPAMARITAEVQTNGIRLSAEGGAACHVSFPAASAERRPAQVWHDHVPTLDAGDEAAAWLSAALGLHCGLVYLDDTRARPVDPAYAQPGDYLAFSDGFPILLANTASLEVLNQELPISIGMTRFRANIVVSYAPAWEEDRWLRIRIGKVMFRVAKPCSRCIVTTVDQLTGMRPDKTEPLRTLGRMRRALGGVMFGQNLIPDGRGRIAIGDPVEILEVGESSVRLLPPAAAE